MGNHRSAARRPCRKSTQLDTPALPATSLYNFFLRRETMVSRASPSVFALPMWCWGLNLAHTHDNISPCPSDLCVCLPSLPLSPFLSLFLCRSHSLAWKINPEPHRKYKSTGRRLFHCLFSQSPAQLWLPMVLGTKPGTSVPQAGVCFLLSPQTSSYATSQNRATEVVYSHTWERHSE